MKLLRLKIFVTIFLIIFTLKSNASDLNKSRKNNVKGAATFELVINGEDIQCDQHISPKGLRSSLKGEYYREKPTCVLSDEISQEFDCMVIESVDFLPEIPELNRMRLKTSSHGFLYISPYQPLVKGKKDTVTRGTWPSAREFESAIDLIENIVVTATRSDNCDY